MRKLKLKRLCIQKRISTKAIYPGSFDPFTNGHLDIIKKASELFDEVVIVVAHNSKKNRTYTADGMVKGIIATLMQNNITNCTVVSWDGLTVELMKALDIKYIVRGLRNTMDYDYEENIAEFNKTLLPCVEYVYLRADNAVISSSMVKELHMYGVDVSEYVPDVINHVINEGRLPSWANDLSCLQYYKDYRFNKIESRLG